MKYLLLILLLGSSFKTSEPIKKQELINVFSEFLTDQQLWPLFEESIKGYGYDLKRLEMKRPLDKVIGSHYYLIEGQTTLVRTDIPKPSGNLQKWKDDVWSNGLWIHVSDKLAKELKGKKDWDEVLNYKQFRLVAVSKNEADWD